MGKKITAGEFEARELERINQAAERLNSEAKDVLDYQTIDRPGLSGDAKDGPEARHHTSPR